MKIVIDVAADENALAALRQRTDCAIECISPPEEKARKLDAAKIKDADVLFCTFPPTNHAVMQSLKWIQIASTGFTQLHGIKLPSRGIQATNSRGCFDVPFGEWNVAMMVIPDVAGASTVAFSECDLHATYLGIESEPAVQRAPLGNLFAKR